MFPHPWLLKLEEAAIITAGFYFLLLVVCTYDGRNAFTPLKRPQVSNK
jgi:hypothetical protein